MNLEKVGVKIWDSVWGSVRNSVYIPMENSVWLSVWNAVDDSVVDFVRNSVDFGLKVSIRQERREQA